MTAFVIVTCMIMADIATGLCYAFFTKSFQSSIMRQGAMHKLGEIMAMAVMYGLEYALPIMGLGVDIPFVNIAATYIIIMEIGSVFENIGHMNPDIGELMDTILSKIKGDKHE